MLRFNIAIYNPENIEIYISQLKVLIQSIWDVYKDSVEIAVLYHSVAESDINEIRNKIPNIVLREYKFDKTIQAKASRKLNLWLELLLDSDIKHQIFLDSDMLLLRKVDRFFDDTFDIGYTYKTDPEEVLKKPLNTGTLLINYGEEKQRKKIRSFLKYWRDKINKIMDSKNFDGATKGWGATDQRVLGETLGTRDINKYKSIIIRKDLRFKGFPCKMLNNILSPSPDNPDTCVIHYKGSWRKILIDGSWERSIRPNTDNDKELYNLWKEKLEKFQNR